MSASTAFWIEVAAVAAGIVIAAVASILKLKKWEPDDHSLRQERQRAEADRAYRLQQALSRRKEEEP